MKRVASPAVALSPLSLLPLLGARSPPTQGDRVQAVPSCGLPMRISLSALLTSSVAPLQFPFFRVVFVAVGQFGGGRVGVVEIEQKWAFSVLQSHWVAVLCGHKSSSSAAGVLSKVCTRFRPSSWVVDLPMCFNPEEVVIPVLI